MVAGGVQQAATTLMGSEQPETTEVGPSELQAANDRIEEAERIAKTATERATRAENELAALKKSWLYRLCPACFRAPTTNDEPT